MMKLMQLPALMVLLCSMCDDPSDDYAPYPQEVTLTEVDVDTLICGEVYFTTITLRDPETGRTTVCDSVASRPDSTVVSLDWLTVTARRESYGIRLKATEPGRSGTIVIEGDADSYWDGRPDYKRITVHRRTGNYR